MAVDREDELRHPVGTLEPAARLEMLDPPGEEFTAVLPARSETGADEDCRGNRGDDDR